MQRRAFLLVGAMIASKVLLGCTTSMTKKLFADRRYRETVSSVLISEDGKHLVILGEKYHYVFENQTDLVNILRMPFHPVVTALLGDFHVTSDQVISGNYDLTINNKASEQDKAEAIAAGFRRTVQGQITFNGKMQGKRYSAEKFTTNKTHQTLNKQYVVNISEEQSSGEKASKALLTPVTVTADGVLTIITIPLVAVMFTVFIMYGGDQ